VSDPLTNILSLVVACVALAVAVAAAVFAKKQADHTKRQADAADEALTAVAESNDIARRALAEAAAVRELAHREWHQNAQPAVTVSRSRTKAKAGGYELTMETDRDLDSCTLELAEGTPLTKVTGLSVGLTETIFNHNPQVVLRNVKAGTPAHPAMWLAPTADGVTVYLRCTATIAGETWGPTVHLVKIPAKPRIITA
jgi:hypothetical protein